MSYEALARMLHLKFSPRVLSNISSFFNGNENSHMMLLVTSLKIPVEFQVCITYRHVTNTQIMLGRLINGIPHGSPSYVRGNKDQFGLGAPIEFRWNHMGKPKAKHPIHLFFQGGPMAMYNALFPNGVRVYETMSNIHVQRVRLQHGSAINRPCSRFKCKTCPLCTSSEVMFINTFITKLQKMVDIPPETLTIESFTSSE